MITLKTILSHWRRSPLQFLVLILGLAMATALWSGVQAINEEARQSYDRSAARLTEAALTRIEGRNDTDIPLIDYVSLRRAGWLVSPVIEGTLATGRDEILVIGIDPLTAPTALSAVFSEGNDATPQFLDPQGVAFVAPGTPNELGETGPRLIETPEIAPGVMMTDISIAARLLQQRDPSYLILALDQPSDLPRLEEIAPNLRLADSPSADLDRLTDSFHLNLSAFGFLSFAVGLFIVHATIGLAFEQRRGMFRTLRALGTSLPILVAALVLEVTVLAAIAGGLGLTLGYFLAAALLPDVAGTLRTLYGANVDGALSFRPIWALSGLGIAVLGAWVAAAQAIYRVINMPLLAPAQPRAWALASVRSLRLQAIGGATLVISGIGFAWFGGNLVTGFLSMAGILIGAALVLPGVLSMILTALTSRATSAKTEWALADLRIQLPGLSIALMALLLALSANIGVSTMVGSFRATFNGWLDQRLMAELYVRADSNDQAEDVRAFLLPRVDAVLPVSFTERSYQSAPIWVYGVVDNASYRDNWPLLDTVSDAWDQLYADEAILINEQMALRHSLAVGDPLSLPNGPELTIAGIYSDYGNPTAQVIISSRLLYATYNDIEHQRTGLRLDPADIPAVTEALRSEFSLAPDAIINQSDLKAQSVAIFDQTFRITEALNILTLAVAAFALFSSMLTLSNMRVPQLAPIWALGMTRANLAGLELVRILCLVALTWAVALPVGLGLAWVLLAVVNVEAFGWRLPLLFFPADWARLLGYALVASFLATLYPALNLLRLPPAQLLKVFSNER